MAHKNIIKYNTREKENFHRSERKKKNTFHNSKKKTYCKYIKYNKFGMIYIWMELNKITDYTEFSSKSANLA